MNYNTHKISYLLSYNTTNPNIRLIYEDLQSPVIMTGRNQFGKISYKILTNTANSNYNSCQMEHAYLQYVLLDGENLTMVLFYPILFIANILLIKSSNKQCKHNENRNSWTFWVKRWLGKKGLLSFSSSSSFLKVVWRLSKLNFTYFSN